MPLFKPKEERNGKFKNFLKKAAGIFPEVIAIGAKVATGNIGGAISDVGALLKEKATTDTQAAALLQEFELSRMDWQLEAFKAEVDDRKDARALYKDDSIIQKVFSMTFLVGYGLLSWYLLSIIMGSSAMPDLAETMITMIWTGTSMKLNTIVDFLFGGSVGSKKGT